MLRGLLVLFLFAGSYVAILLSASLEKTSSFLARGLYVVVLFCLSYTLVSESLLLIRIYRRIRHGASTLLLFPFVTNAPGVGFDTGIVIINTTKGRPDAEPQHGNVTLFFYPDEQMARTYVTPCVMAGDTWAGSLSTFSPGFQGYIIAHCNFRCAHGFAMFTGQYQPRETQIGPSYLAIVITP
jgi:hypothetical protein